MFGVDVPILNLRVPVNTVKQPIKRNSVGAWHVSQYGTSTFDNHLIYGFIILKDMRCI